MRNLLLVVPLVLLLVACPALDFTPDGGEAAGVTLSAEGQTYRIDTIVPVERAFLRFIGTDLTEDNPDCVVEAGAVECITGAFNEFFEVTVGGVVMNDAALPIGIVCVDAGCFELYLEPSL